MILAFGFNLQANHDTKEISAPGALPQALLVILLYFCPHQIVNCLVAVIIRRNRPDVGIPPILGVGAERPAGVVPFATARVDRQVAVPDAHVPRLQVGQLVPGLALGLDDLAAQQVAGARDLAAVVGDAFAWSE